MRCTTIIYFGGIFVCAYAVMMVVRLTPGTNAGKNCSLYVDVVQWPTPVSRVRPVKSLRYQAATDTPDEISRPIFRTHISFCC